MAYGDPATGAFAAFLLNAALVDRARTNRGLYIDLSMLEVLEMVSPEILLEYAMNRRDPTPIGNHDAILSPHNCYKALGDAEKWVTIAVGNEDDWRRLCHAMEQPRLAYDPRFRSAELRKRNEADLDRIITDWTSLRDRWETTEFLQRAGVAAFPTLNNKDVALDTHMRARGFFVELEHPEVGRRRHPGVCWTMSATPCSVRRPAPILGENTDAVLSRLLGYSQSELDALRQAEILA
jgi:crotonobetainyl-CoA:carnitine CoA-transferase CaiB-like acyl-CoA transferase